MLLMILSAIIIFLVFSFIHFAAKKKKPFKWALLSMLSGPAVLCAINLTAALTGVWVPVTRLTLLVSVAGGIPGDALLVLLSAF